MPGHSAEEFNRRDPTHPACYEADLEAHEDRLLTPDALFGKYIHDPALMSIMKDTITNEKKLHNSRRLTKNPRKIYIGGKLYEYKYDGSFRGKVMHVDTVYACDYCMDTFPNMADLKRHENENCSQLTPPGRIIYRDPTRNFEVRECCGLNDGSFVTRLAVVGKCFVETKTLQDNLEPFNFYVLFDTKDDDRRHCIGFFSKQKYSASDINLNCFATMPAYRNQGYGFFMIELSFLLSDVENSPGLPEAPVSVAASSLYYHVISTKIMEYIFDYCMKYADTYPYTDNKFSLVQMAYDTGIHTRLLRLVMNKEKWIEVDDHDVDKITIDMCDLCIHHKETEERNKRIMVYREHLNYSQPHHFDFHKAHHMKSNEEEQEVREQTMKASVTFIIKKGLTMEEFNKLVKQGFGQSLSYAFVHKSEITEVPKLGPRKYNANAKKGGKKMRRNDFAH